MPHLHPLPHLQTYRPIQFGHGRGYAVATRSVEENRLVDQVIITETLTVGGERLVIRVPVARHLFVENQHVVDEYLDREIARHLEARPELLPDPLAIADGDVFPPLLPVRPVQAVEVPADANRVRNPGEQPGLTLPDLHAAGTAMRQLHDLRAGMVRIDEEAFRIQPGALRYHFAEEEVAGGAYARGGVLPGYLVRGDFEVDLNGPVTYTPTTGTWPAERGEINVTAPQFPGKLADENDCACGDPDDAAWQHNHDECTYLDRPVTEWYNEGAAEAADPTDPS